MSTIRYVADDNGHSYHKLAWHDGSAIRTLKIPTIVGDGARAITDTNGVAVNTYEINGRRFCCHPQIQAPIQIRNEGYQDSDENMALVCHGIAQAGLADQALVLGVTLPWRDAYQQSGEPNEAKKVAVASHYTNSRAAVLPSRAPLSIRKTKAYPEGLAAFFDWAISDEGSLERVEAVTGPVAVIDIGGSTTDIITVLSGDQLSLDHARSDTLKQGVMDAKRQFRSDLSSILRAELGMNPDADGGIPEWLLAKAFDTGSVSIGTRGIDVGDQIREAKRAVASDLVSFIKSTLSNVLAFEAMVIAGGGAIFFKEDLMAAFPMATFTDEFANARGTLKYMTHLDRSFFELEVA